MTSETKKTPDLRPMTVGLDEPELTGGFLQAMVQQDASWNGWAIPYFARDAAEQLSRSFLEGPLGEEGARLTFDAATREWVEYDPNYDGDEAYTRYAAVSVDGVEMWSIGGWSWTWQVWTDEEVAQLAAAAAQAELEAADERLGRQAR